MGRRPKNSVRGISSGVQVTVGVSKARKYRPAGLAKRLEESQNARLALLKDIDMRQREVLLSMNDSDNVWDDIDVPAAAPPLGDEGFLHSHEGGEFAIYDELNTILRPHMKYQDTRTRDDRQRQMAIDWAAQMNDLTDALLAFRHAPIHPICGGESSESDVFSIETVDIFSRQLHVFPRVHAYTNVSLMRHGYIGASPIAPTIAFSIRTFDVYRQTHRVCPRLSIHAEVRKLCHLHDVPYHRYLAEQFRHAYDVYLECQRHIERLLRSALGQTGPHFRIRNSCAACTYTVENEPQLRFSRLIALDGNNSLKQVDPSFRHGREHCDGRQGTSEIWLSAEYVDDFKNEVRHSNSQEDSSLVNISADHEDNADDWVDVGSDSRLPSTCVDRWRTASPEAKKRMFAIFSKSGIFISVCRHGFPLTICDMIRSGELMKYPLATVHRLLDALGPDQLIGYDIKCSFWKILLASSISTSVKNQNLQGVVPAFHGHAHNRLCQLQHHSKYMKGAGIEDFETCERTFSESNALACETRFASEFHRHQAIDEHFKFVDDDKYAALSSFILNNYRQALTKIVSAEAALQAFPLMQSHDYETDFKEELQYLLRVGGQVEEPQLEMDYVIALNELDEAESAYAIARSDLRHLDYRILNDGFTRKEIADVRRHHTHAYNKVILRQQHVEDFEHQMGVEERWQRDHPDRVKAQGRITHRLFYKAVDDVERLVVMRLLELTKLQMSGTGYKLRTQIAKALKTRGSAIRNAITRYNKYAAELEPPRPPLAWEQIVEYSFLAEFDLLRETNPEIQAKRWADPVVRHTAAQYFDLQRAREEIQRCDVEVLRLMTKIRDDNIDYPRIIRTLEVTNVPLAFELNRRWQYLRKVNHIHLARISEIQSLPGYTGPQQPGWRVGRQKDLDLREALLEPVVGLSEDEDPSLHEDAVDQEVLNVGEFFASLYISGSHE